MGQPHSLAASCPTGGGLATALQPAGQNRTFLLGVDTDAPPLPPPRHAPRSAPTAPALLPLRRARALPPRALSPLLPPPAPGPRPLRGAPRESPQPRPLGPRSPTRAVGRAAPRRAAPAAAPRHTLMREEREGKSEEKTAALAHATAVPPAPLVDLVLDGLASEHSRRAYRRALGEFFYLVSVKRHRRRFYQGRRPALSLAPGRTRAGPRLDQPGARRHPVKALSAARAPVLASLRDGRSRSREATAPCAHVAAETLRADSPYQNIRLLKNVLR